MNVSEMNRDQVRELLAPLWRKNRELVLARLDHVRSQLSAPHAELPDDVREDLHALIGTLGTYGWPEGSALATRVKRILDAEPAVAHPDLLAELDALRAELVAA